MFDEVLSKEKLNSLANLLCNFNFSILLFVYSLARVVLFANACIYIISFYFYSRLVYDCVSYNICKS